MPAAKPPDPVSDPPDFSLVLGGPLFQMLRRARLSDPALGLAHRRVAAAVLVMWAPLVLLTAAQGGLTGTAPPTPFLLDVGFQLRFLVVAPLLILAERLVHRRMLPIAGEFRRRGLVPRGQIAGLDAALAEAARWRNSVLAEVVLLAVVYAAGLSVTLGRYLSLDPHGWYGLPGQGLSPAGLWLVFVSLPLLQFLLLRWYYRLFVWARFLWRVARLDLDLNALHPDRAGGLGFLSDSVVAFVPLASAHGVLLAGMMADRILFGGAQLTQFNVEVAGGALLLLAVFAGPLTLLTPKLALTKRLGLLAYGALGQDYVRAFREKWLSGRPAGEPLIGSADLQSLADLGNSYAAAEQMRMAPIRLRGLAAFLAAFLAPIAPLLLTMMSAEKLLAQMVGVLF